MIAATWSVLAAAATVLGAPLLLTARPWQTRRPGTALGLWCLAVVCGCVAAAVGLGVAVTYAVAPTDAATRSPQLPGSTALTIIAWSGLTVVGGLLALVMAKAEGLLQERRRLVALCETLTSAGIYENAWSGPVAVDFVVSHVPLALSVPGRPGRVVLTSGLEDVLTPGQVQAVIAHERAHLVQRHAWIVRLADLNATCLPWLYGARRFQGAVRLLVELVADDSAARLRSRRRRRRPGCPGPPAGGRGADVARAAADPARCARCSPERDVRLLEGENPVVRPGHVPARA
ncbi:MAG TPA: M56 family metallopeptidase [Kineosporiaceae bacterium]|nr:M56 family metallopeptidase [Kineosporiaceae bacterium]